MAGIDLMRQLMLHEIRLLFEHFRTDFAEMRIDHVVHTIDVRIEKCETSKSGKINGARLRIEPCTDSCHVNMMTEIQRKYCMLTVVHIDHI